MSGTLLLVATPIGNLEDLSTRAVRVLGEVAWVACEDTRRSRALFSAAGIPAGSRLRAFHAHNETEMIPAVLATLAADESVALVSDAGTPAISDPGQRLVAAVAEAGYIVSVVPGPSAVLGALVVSGFPTDRFVVEGFLPRKGKERASRLASLAHEPRTVVVLESPGRLVATLRDLAALDPTRRVAVVRELTKLHEEAWRGALGDAVVEFDSRERLRGEITIVVSGAIEVADEIGADRLSEAARRALERGLATKAAAEEVAAALGVSRRVAYDAVLDAHD